MSKKRKLNSIQRIDIFLKLFIQFIFASFSLLVESIVEKNEAVSLKTQLSTIDNDSMGDNDLRVLSEEIVPPVKVIAAKTKEEKEKEKNLRKKERRIARLNSLLTLAEHTDHKELILEVENTSEIENVSNDSDSLLTEIEVYSPDKMSSDSFDIATLPPTPVQNNSLSDEWVDLYDQKILNDSSPVQKKITS